MKGYVSLPVDGAFLEPFKISVKLAQGLSDNTNKHAEMIRTAVKDVIDFVATDENYSSYNGLCTTAQMHHDPDKVYLYYHGSLIIGLSILLLAKRHGNVFITMETYNNKMYGLVSTTCTTDIKDPEISDGAIAKGVVNKLKESRNSCAWYMINLIKALKAENYIEEKVDISVSPGINVEGQTIFQKPALVIINPVVVPDNWKNIANTTARDVLTARDMLPRHAKENSPPVVANFGTASSEYKRTTDRASDDGLDKFDDEDSEDNDSEYSNTSNDDSDNEESENKNNNTRDTSKQQEGVRLKYAEAMMCTLFRAGFVLPLGIGATFKPEIEKQIIKHKGNGAKETIGMQLYSVNLNAKNSGMSGTQSFTNAFNGSVSKSKVRVAFSII